MPELTDVLDALQEPNRSMFFNYVLKAEHELVASLRSGHGDLRLVILSLAPSYALEAYCDQEVPTEEQWRIFVANLFTTVLSTYGYSGAFPTLDPVLSGMLYQTSFDFLVIPLFNMILEGIKS